ncbi:sterol 26-hydroxylase, mitochondrial-like [Homalodisca vitripennis]|uniref:sterol 26-hydroxylase, mitochondrial-like n=1 Tax=Homalodisca vitripennis TaxID=197043 RepID=UPI001EECD3EF|nr:sterol 26-hydroxylase, mitochondrial-like [Homalodisca vitripennis]
MSLYTSGRSEQNFPDAERFWPTRWLRNEAGKYPGVTEATASLPFAMGGRACIGRKVADTLMSLTLAQILSQFHVNIKKEIEMVLMLVPVPAEPVTLYLSKRV